MKLVYFAWLRERLNISEEEVQLPESIETIADLMDWQKSRDEVFADVFEHSDIIQVAVDQKHVLARNSSLKGAKEIAMFPPMTGG